MGFNKIILEGRLTKDPELRYSQSGMAMAKSSIAVSKKFTSNGEKKEKTLFVNIQFWQRSAEVFNQYCRKGSHLLIEGELENANWTDKNGNKKYDFIVNVSNMQMLDSKGSNENNTQAPQETNEPQGGQGYQPRNDRQSTGSYGDQEPKDNVPTVDIDDDEIPF